MSELIEQPTLATPTATSAVALATNLPEPTLPAGFDYDALGPDLARRTRARVAIIHEHNHRVRESIFSIGMEGVGLKEEHPYGQFMRIVEAEFGAGYHDTLNKCMAVYERLGDDRFRTVRNLRLNPTTLYALAQRSTPEWVRCEIADAIASGAIPTDKTLDAEIKKRIVEARHAGVLPQDPDTVEAAQARQLARRDYALAAVQILKAALPPADFARFNFLVSRAGPEFDRVRLARTPEYGFGFVTGDVPVGSNGMLLTLRQLEDHVLDRDSTPPRHEE